jgi:hypothetical protein
MPLCEWDCGLGAMPVCHAHLWDGPQFPLASLHFISRTLELDRCRAPLPNRIKGTNLLFIPIGKMETPSRSAPSEFTLGAVLHCRDTKLVIVKMRECAVCSHPDASAKPPASSWDAAFPAMPVPEFGKCLSQPCPPTVAPARCAAQSVCRHRLRRIARRAPRPCH